MAIKGITSCLWYDSEAEEAAKLYVSVFKNSKMGKVTRYGKEGFEIHGQPQGKVMTVDFELEGARFVALNGGPLFKFNESVSFQIHCETQDEIDYYWNRLTADGGQESQCGWLKDKFGLSWQVTPLALIEMLSGDDKAGAQRVTKAFLQMKKFDIAALKRAYEGKG
jgi:predicted 3-demethylubiquinone-9 3-methyltransferase (glyoxalase superfamily)